MGVQDWDSVCWTASPLPLRLHQAASQLGELGDFLSFFALAEKKLSAKVILMFNQINCLTQS